VKILLFHNPLFPRRDLQELHQMIREAMRDGVKAGWAKPIREGRRTIGWTLDDCDLIEAIHHVPMFHHVVKTESANEESAA
jgi:hypothetical protein